MDNESNVMSEASKRREAIRRQFEKMHVRGPLSLLRYWLFLKSTKRQKIRDIWAAHLDQNFFRNEMGDKLYYDDTADRTLLMAERQLPPDKQDPAKIDEIELRIAKSKSVKQQYRKNEEFIAEVNMYVDGLDRGRNTMFTGDFHVQK